MNRPIRSSALLAAALAATTLAFAPAPNASTAPTAATDGAIAAAAVIDGEPVVTVRGQSSRTGFAPGEAPNDLVSWMRATRRIAEAAGLDTMAATDACFPLAVTESARSMDCEDPEDGEGGGEDWEDSFTFSYLEAAGDLDGDGWDDVMEITVTYGWDDYSESTTVRSGVDGTELWTFDTAGDFDAGSFLVLGPDLDGDGGEDLLRVGYEGSGEWSDSCTPIRCTFTDSFTDTMTLTALRGATGDELGSTSIESSFSFEFGSTSVFESIGSYEAFAAAADHSVTVVNGVTGFDFVDVDGDGSNQLLLGTVDVESEGNAVYAGTFDGSAFNDAVVGRQGVSVSSEVELIDLTDGSSSIVRDVEDAVTYPVGVTLDGTDAIVVDHFPAPDEPTVGGCVFSDSLSVYDCGDSAGLGLSDDAPTRTLLAGADLDERWTAAADPYSLVVFEAGGDVDGDGADDLLDVVIDFDAFELVTTAIAGSTGTALWTAPIAGGVVDDGGFLGVTFDVDEQYDDESYEATVTARGLRIDGVTGEVVTEETLASITVSDDGEEIREGFLGVSPAQLDGDGTDLATLVETYLLEVIDREEECYEEEDPDTGEVYEVCWEWVVYDIVESDSQLVGHDGRELAKILDRDLDGTYLDGLLDVDGDGRDELLLMTFDDDWSDVTTAAERTDGSTIWTLPSAYLDGVLTTPTGFALITGQTQDGATVVRDAADLTELWRTAPVDSIEFAEVVVAVTVVG